MAINFTFQEEHFNRIFPFYILIDQQLTVEATGSTLKKIFADTTGKKFLQNYQIKRPELKVPDFESLKSLHGQLLIVECLNEKKTTLRGQIDFLPETGKLLFMGSPWFDSIEEIVENNLSLHDFAFHDAMTDLLHVMKTQENTNDDLKFLLKTVSRQKDELKNASLANHDVALFTTQNPDPLMRINFAGDLLQNNPAAARLDFLEHENKVYRNDDFFKLIAEKIDKENKRWMIEARSEGVDYSFVCVTMHAEGYINIYGRDITRQKKDRRELERLSLIVQQTINAVIITDAGGKIEWVNTAFEKVTGYTLAEALGKAPGSFLQGQGTDPETVAYMKEQIIKSEPFSCEIYNYKKDGTGYWLRINGQPVFDKAGNVINFFAIEEDITREREAEEKLKEFDKRINVAMQKIGDNVWEHDFITEQTSFSQEEYQLLGYTSEEYKNNVNLWYSCIHPDDKKLVEVNDVQYRTGQIDHHTLEYRIVHKDGTVKWVLDRGVVIEKNKEGKPVKIIGTHSDITQQKENEKELEATATRLSSLIANLHAGVLLESENRTVKLANRQFCDMFNIQADPAQLTGMDCSNSAEQSKHFFIDPDGFIAGINKLLKERKTVTGDKLQLVDGRFFERDFIPIWNDGRYDGHLWVYQDITEKINADKKLEDQRKFYEEILDNIPSDIAVFDSNHRYLYLNPVAIKDPELRKWMIGKTDEDYVAYRNKPASLVEGRRKIFNGVIVSKKLKHWEEKLIQPDGSTRYIMRNMFPVLNKDNEVSLVIGYGLDITNIKNIQQQVEQSEKKYRDVIDNSLAIVTTHDMNGKFITVNPMVGKVYGYSDEEMVGHSLKEFIPEEDKLLFNEQYLDKIKNQKQSSGIFRVLNKDGRVIYTLYNNFLKEEEGKEPYVIAFAVDITDRILAEKELKIAKKVTEEMVQTKQNFLANMSHEIRTPMNAIMGMSRQLQKTALNEKQHVYLDSITAASENLLIIINDILDLSKLEAGKLALEKIGFEPKMVMGMVMQVMNHKAEEKGLQLTNTYCDAQLSPILIGDPYRINQVMLNLVSNSIKFTETGSVDITCKVISNSSLVQQVQITVKDTGIGMDPDFVKNLFQKFRQEDESVARRFGGTGLGMSITKELVELMGGEIEVASEKGKGTEISIRFTFEKGTEKDLPQKNIASANTGILHNKKILVVDDNEMNRLVATTILQEYGVLLTEATNGEEATGFMREQDFDLVLMDIQMPVMNGLDATAYIRKELRSVVPVIALTANAIRGENEKCFAAGMNDYLSKPFEESQLIQIVSRWIDIKPVNITGGDTVVINDNSTSLYDLSKLTDIAKGNETFIKRMLQLFVDQVPAAVEEIKQAFAAADLAKVKSVAHRIKPSIDSMSIVSIKEDIRNIELNAAELQAAGQLEKLICKLDTVISEVVFDIEKRK